MIVMSHSDNDDIFALEIVLSSTLQTTQEMRFSVKGDTKKMIGSDWLLCDPIIENSMLHGYR